MLSKTTYRQVVKKLESLRKQDNQDRHENPTALPIDWSGSIKAMIERTVRENRERYSKGQAEEVIQGFVDKGLLVPYLGGVAFPGKQLPTRDEVVERVEKILDSLS